MSFKMRNKISVLQIGQAEEMKSLLNMKEDDQSGIPE